MLPRFGGVYEKIIIAGWLACVWLLELKPNRAAQALKQSSKRLSKSRLRVIREIVRILTIRHVMVVVVVSVVLIIVQADMRRFAIRKM